jgi:hypothetical protein
LGVDLLEFFIASGDLTCSDPANDGDIALGQQTQARRLGGDVVLACPAESIGGIGVPSQGEIKGAAEPDSRSCRASSSHRSPTRRSISSAAALAAGKRTARSPARRSSLTRSCALATRLLRDSAAGSVMKPPPAVHQETDSSPCNVVRCMSRLLSSG